MNFNFESDGEKESNELNWHESKIDALQDHKNDINTVCVF
jgi:hypothetical protein